MLLRFTPTASTTGHHTLRSMYVEACWLPIVGPSGVALLRVLPQLWASVGSPATITDDVLAGMLGIKPDRLHATLRRLTRFGLVATSSDADGEFDVPIAVPWLTATQLERSPRWARLYHESLSAGVPA